MQAKLTELKNLLREVNDLTSAASLLLWDQLVYMPAGGSPARARQLATLRRLAHEQFTDPQVGKLLDGLRPLEESLPYASDDASLIRVTRRDYEKAVRIPPDFMARLIQHRSDAYQVWAEARREGDFDLVRPSLERTLDLSRQMADFFPGYEHIADPLIDFSDPEMKTASVRTLFTELRDRLVPLVADVTALPVADDGSLMQFYPEAQQLAFGKEVIERLGFDFERGRQDKTLHPFMIKFSLGDIRITTRVKEDNLGEAFFCTLHEAGHAMYEQGIASSSEGTPLAGAASNGVHESQSRLWENLVGRSRGFWEWAYPELQGVFPEQLESVPLEVFYRAINKVQRSLIRVDADELTYNLHVIIRFDLELEMLEGGLEVRHLPEAWRSRYLSDLGVQPSSDRDGVLQDVHWFDGMIGGAFQGYTLGNILSAQFFNTAVAAHPEISIEMKRGEFGTLHNWLKENVYQVGRRFTVEELVERATGSSMSVDPYMRYLEAKYGELYGF